MGEILLSGYQKCNYADPFEDLIGPLGYKVDGHRVSFGFKVESRHCNTQGTPHGGMLMTFADYALCLAATWDRPDEKCVTVSLNCEFAAAGMIGDILESTAEVVRRTRSLTFVHGQIFVGKRTLVNYSGIVKRILPKGGRVR